MGKIILIFIVIFIFLVFYNNKLKIKWKTFLKPGFKMKKGKFGVYCYCGKQGSGKTYSVVEYLLENRDKRIYSNIKSIEGVDFISIDGFDDLLKLRTEHDCIIVFDEIFTALTKTSKMTTEVLDFLSQMRKRQIIFLTTAQEWLEINMTLRRYCRFQIECNMFNIFGTAVLKKTFYDAENMKWSQLENEYVAPLLETTISKATLEVARSYDTYEQIRTTSKSKK